MPDYLTEYIKETQYERPWPDMVWVKKIAGPRIAAHTWQEAERKLDALKELGMVHPDIEIIEEYDA